MVCPKLGVAADMDIFWQRSHISPEIILVVRRLKLCESDIQIEIVFRPGRRNSRQGLVKEPQRLWYFIGFSAQQCLSYPFTGIHSNFP
jgi:hypothetical protein